MPTRSGRVAVRWLAILAIHVDVLGPTDSLRQVVLVTWNTCLWDSMSLAFFEFHFSVQGNIGIQIN